MSVSLNTVSIIRNLTVVFCAFSGFSTSAFPPNTYWILYQGSLAFFPGNVLLKIIEKFLYYIFKFVLTIIPSSAPIRVVDLRLDIPVVVVVAANREPVNAQRFLVVNVFECLLKKQSKIADFKYKTP